ncbi:unnamed protein product [Closterium sp. NIES-53]
MASVSPISRRPFNPISSLSLCQFTERLAPASPPPIGSHLGNIQLVDCPLPTISSPPCTPLLQFPSHTYPPLTDSHLGDIQLVNAAPPLAGNTKRVLYGFRQPQQQPPLQSPLAFLPALPTAATGAASAACAAWRRPRPSRRLPQRLLPPPFLLPLLLFIHNFIFLLIALLVCLYRVAVRTNIVQLIGFYGIRGFSIRRRAATGSRRPILRLHSHEPLPESAVPSFQSLSQS